MKLFIGFFIFCIILFLYLHIQFQLKTSDDLEVYEMDDVSKDKLEEICDLRQPAIFSFDNESIIKSTSKDALMSNYHAFEVKVRNVKEKDCTVLPLKIHDSIKLFEQDKESQYFSENNGDFLQETGVIKALQYNDEYLRPYMVSNCNYDIMMGTEGVETPFRYELNYRNYFTVTQGSVKIKLTPHKNTKYLDSINDYENFEFRSAANPWILDPMCKYKCLEVNLNVGQTIYIPAYWWYSVKFDKNASLVCFRYRTYMNNVAIVPNIIMYALQTQNVKRQLVKQADQAEEVSSGPNLEKKESDLIDTDNQVKI